MKAHTLAVLVAVVGLSCSDSSAPRPLPAPTAPPDASGASGELPPGHPPIQGMPPHAPDASSSEPLVTGTITLAEELGSALLPTDVLYVMAKKDGATTAVRRVDAPQFPFAFELGSGDAMMAGAGLEGPVDIVVRVSKTGDAIPSAGDLEGTTAGVALPSSGVAVAIDTVRN